ncbi:MAG: hypothetical protein WEB87_07630, partial [Bacteriovoracaceae bacterium]
SGDVFKEVFIDTVLLNVSDYFLYFGFMTAAIFLFGLFVSYLALRPFQKIEEFCQEAADDPELEFEVDKINQSKSVFQGAKLLFDYLFILKNDLEDRQLEVPKSLVKMKRPVMDKVFLMQYTLLVMIVCLVTNTLIFTFTQDLYEQIVGAGLSLLDGNRVVATFMQQQETTLFSIYAMAIGINVALYLSLSRNLIKSVDGVSYAFCRDILGVVRGNTSKRLFPRFSDPGKGAALALNDYMDYVFEEEEFEEEEEEESHVHASLFDIDTSPAEPKLNPASDKVLDLSDKIEERSLEEAKQEEEEELPPAFVEQKQVANGSIFQVTTPKGYKVENLSESQVLKLIKEIETKD